MLKLNLTVEEGYILFELGCDFEVLLISVCMNEGVPIAIEAWQRVETRLLTASNLMSITLTLKFCVLGLIMIDKIIKSY